MVDNKYKYPKDRKVESPNNVLDTLSVSSIKKGFSYRTVNKNKL